MTARTATPPTDDQLQVLAEALSAKGLDDIWIGRIDSMAWGGESCSTRALEVWSSRAARASTPNRAAAVAEP